MASVFRQRIDQYQRTFTEARSVNDRQSEAHALVCLGEAYSELSEIEQAQGVLQEALTLAHEIGEPRVAAQALTDLGLLFLRQGEMRKAIHYSMEALDAASLLSDLNLQLALLDNLIEAYKEDGEPDKASICVEHRHVIVQELENRVGNDERDAHSYPHVTNETGQGIGKGGLNKPQMMESTKEPSLLSRLVGGTTFTGLGRLSSVVFSLVSVLLVTRALPAEDYGAYVILRVVVLFLGQVSSIGLETALPVFIGKAQDADTRRRTFSTVLYSRLLTIVVFSLIAIPFRTQIMALLGSSAERELVVFIPILFLLETLLGLMQSALQSFLRFNRIGISDFIAGMTNLLLIVVFVLWLRLGFLGLIYARCLALGIALVFTWFSLPIQKRFEFDFDILRSLVKFGAPLQVNSILSFIFGRIDTVLVGLLLGAEGVAFYEIARKIPDSLSQIFEAYRMVYYPYMSRFFAEKQWDRLGKLLNNSNRLISFVSLSGALVTMLFGQELVSMLFTSEYAPSVAPLIVLMIGLCFFMIGYILGTSLVAIGDTTKPPLINIFHMAATVIGNLLLIPRFGITGAAIASMAGSVVTNPLNVYFLRRRDVAVNTLSYVKSMVIFAVHAAVYFVLQPASLWIRGLFVVTFLCSSFLFAVVTLADVELLIAEVRPLILRTLGAVRLTVIKS
jgi:O-antigen/teichoic acid export membrane protein